MTVVERLGVARSRGHLFRQSRTSSTSLASSHKIPLRFSLTTTEHFCYNSVVHSRGGTSCLHSTAPANPPPFPPASHHACVTHIFNIVMHNALRSATRSQSRARLNVPECP